MKIRYDTEKEMYIAREVVEKFDDAIAKDVAAKIGKRPVFITGMGSSLLFPAKNAKRRAQLLLPEHRVEIDFPPNYNPETLPQDAYVFLSSNSGNTVEIVDMADALTARHIEFFGVTTNTDSKLGQRCSQNNLYLLHQPFEKGVAATKSIIEQALFYDAVIHYLAGAEFPLRSGTDTNKRVAEKMRQNFTADLSASLIVAGAEAGTYYWNDHNTGAAEELALKSCEIAGKRGVYESGTQILHGRGEVIRPDDLVFVLSPQSYKQKDLSAMVSLAEKTGSVLVSVGGSANGFQTLPAEVEQGLELYCLIPACWNFLRCTGRAMGRDIDHPNVAQKARVEK